MISYFIAIGIIVAITGLFCLGFFIYLHKTENTKNSSIEKKEVKTEIEKSLNDNKDLIKTKKNTVNKSKTKNENKDKSNKSFEDLNL